MVSKPSFQDVVDFLDLDYRYKSVIIQISHNPYYRETNPDRYMRGSAYVSEVTAVAMSNIYCLKISKNLNMVIRPIYVNQYIKETSRHNKLDNGNVLSH